MVDDFPGDLLQVVDLGGDLLVGNVLVEPAHLGQGPVPLLDQGVDLRVSGGLGLRLLLLLGRGLFLRLRLAGDLIGLVREDGLGDYKNYQGRHSAGDELHHRVQWEQQRIDQPGHADEIDREHRTLYMLGHILFLRRPLGPLQP